MKGKLSLTRKKETNGLLFSAATNIFLDCALMHIDVRSKAKRSRYTPRCCCSPIHRTVSRRAVIKANTFPLNLQLGFFLSRKDFHKSIGFCLKTPFHAIQHPLPPSERSEGVFKQTLLQRKRRTVLPNQNYHTSWSCSILLFFILDFFIKHTTDAIFCV